MRQDVNVKNRHAFGGLTEAPGGRVSREGADMLGSRYAYGAQVGADAKVLEVGCGPGIGLGLLSQAASFVVGADFDPELLHKARETYDASIPLVQLDVQGLPFVDGAFDVVLFYEASYYVSDMDRAFDEIARVIGNDGQAVFVNANPERPGFIPSPLSVHYHTAEDFRSELERRGFSVRVEGAYPVRRGTSRERLGVVARQMARRMGIIPRTLRTRALVKRMFGARLLPVPRELSSWFSRPAERVPINPGQSATHFKVLYVTAVRRTM